VICGWFSRNFRLDLPESLYRPRFRFLKLSQLIKVCWAVHFCSELLTLPGNCFGLRIFGSRGRYRNLFILLGQDCKKGLTPAVIGR